MTWIRTRIGLSSLGSSVEVVQCPICLKTLNSVAFAVQLCDGYYIAMKCDRDISIGMLH